MFLSNTSLIPTVLTLSDFFIKSFPHIWWYPYWYLGNPYRYLIGPVVPVLLSFLNLFNLPLLYSYLFLILGSFILGSFGMYLLLKDWGLEKKQALFSAFLYLILPGGIYLLNYQNGLGHFAFGVFPYLLLVYRIFLQNKRLSSALLLSILISFVLLIDISMLLPLTVGFASIFLSRDEEDKRDFGNLIGITIVIILLSISIATLWYTPRFWLVNLVSPSFGGVPLFRLIATLFQFLFSFLPIGLAILVVHFRKFRPKGYMFFSVLFFSSFLFLTIVRFLSDPDFVMDWIGFGLELQFGLVILLMGIFTKIEKNRGIFLSLSLLIISVILDGYIFSNLTIQKSHNDYQKRIITMLKANIKENERVFLSGSSVFFLNSDLNISQVRGGVDQAAIHPLWAHGAFQIREGTNPELTYDWLKAFGASYILIHNNKSLEPFHDFKHPEKFDQLHLVSEKSGDLLYKVEKSQIARIAGSAILNVEKPKNRADAQSLSEYVSSIKRPAQFFYRKPTQIEIHAVLQKNEILSLAVSYDPRWRLIKGSGVIHSDNLGNIAIVPLTAGEQNFRLVYAAKWYDIYPSIFISCSLLLALLYFRRVSEQIIKRIKGINAGLFSEDDDY